SAVPLGEPEPHPPLHQLAQQRQPQHDRHRGDADGAKAGERTVAHDAAHHHPQTRQPQRDQYEADHETQGEQEYRERVAHGPSPNSQTMPPWLVWRAMSRMKSAGGRTSAGSSERTSPASSAQSPPMPAYTATYCLPSGPVNVIGLPTTPDPTLNFQSARPLVASTALNQPSRVP